MATTPSSSSSSSSSSLLFLLVILTISTILLFSTVDASTGSHNFDWISSTTTKSTASSTCQGSIAECSLEAFDEFGMDSEINRRILATTQYISYEALRRNSVPCSQRGASYYNCQAGAQANPYTRGCSAITRCRS